MKFHTIDARVHHNNSSTLKSGYQDRNAKTFQRNRSLLTNKRAAKDLRERGWSLDIRRENSWD